MTTIVLWVANLEKSVNFYKALFEDNAPYISETFASVSTKTNQALAKTTQSSQSSQSTASNSPS